MKTNTMRARTWVAAAVFGSIAALTLPACVSQSEYEELKAQQNFEEAGDLLFPSGGYQLSAAGQSDLDKNVIPRLKTYQNVKIVVYGYTDNVPVSSQMRQAGIPDNLALSSRRASTVASYLVSKGIDPNIISAKGFGETHPKTTNDTPEGRAANRRIVITVQGPGATGS